MERIRNDECLEDVYKYNNVCRFWKKNYCYLLFNQKTQNWIPLIPCTWRTTHYSVKTGSFPWLLASFLQFVTMRKLSSIMHCFCIRIVIWCFVVIRFYFVVHSKMREQFCSESIDLLNIIISKNSFKIPKI